MRCPECGVEMTPWTIGIFGDFSDPRAVWLRCTACRYAWPIPWWEADYETRRDALLAERSRRAVDGAA